MAVEISINPRLSRLIKPAEENIHTLEVQMVSLDDPDNQFRTNIGNMEHRHAQSQLELQRKQDLVIKQGKAQ